MNLAQRPPPLKYLVLVCMFGPVELFKTNGTCELARGADFLKKKNHINLKCWGNFLMLLGGRLLWIITFALTVFG